MCSLVVCSIVFLDGFSAGPGGDVLAQPFDDGFNAYALERLRAADTAPAGRGPSAGRLVTFAAPLRRPERLTCGGAA